MMQNQGKKYSITYIGEVLRIDDDIDTLYFAKWNDGPLYYKKKWARKSNKVVTLKYFYNSQNIIKLLNEIKFDKCLNIYGVSQNPDMGDYIIVFPKLYCKKCDKKYKGRFDANYECGLLNEIKEDLNKYYAVWNDGPLLHNNKKWARESNKKVSLKLYNLQNIDEFLNEVKKYLSRNDNPVYGISQNQDLKYIIVFQYDLCCKSCGEEYTENNFKFEWCKKCQVNYLELNFKNWTSNNDKIDNLIQNMQLKINSKWDMNDFLYYDNLYSKDQIRRLKLRVTLKYSQNIIDEVEEYSITIWKDGPSSYNEYEYSRNQKKVALKQLYNSQNITIEFLNEIKGYSIKELNHVLSIYGLSQNPNTNDYIMVLDYAEATGNQPFFNCAHNEMLALDICEGIRPEINELEVPKCYTELMKKCWNSNPDYRPKATEIVEFIQLFHESYVPDSSLLFGEKKQQHYDIEQQFKKVEEYKKTFFEERRQSITHPQAVYTSQLLNSFTNDLPKYSECLDCEI
ncbi:kinase-like domain-containing protein [Rhizophagus irregularis DAOM 181602=DAOM 197198]|nr:kinase-like domain-containing protein [Rhizophagus irregularis DAOM 181602=DAOM 197198]